MDIDLDTLSNDAAAAQKPVPAVTLNEVMALAQQQLVLEQEVEALEASLDHKKKELKDIAEHKLPDMLTEVGLKDITLSDGSIITVVDNIFASIDETNREAAHKWLREAGFGDLIKNTVTVTFGKGEDKDAELLIHNIKVMADTNALKYGTLDQKEQVHNSTLRAFIKERLKNGESLPVETFKLFEGKLAKLKRPKAKF